MPLAFSNGINDLSVLESRELLALDTRERLRPLELLEWPREELPSSKVSS